MQQNINGKTKLLGVIGNPIEHTISPTIHNTLAKMLNMNFVYVPFKVDYNNLGKAIEGAQALNIVGLNITVPYKEKVIPSLCDIMPLAKQIGAVNTLKLTEKGYIGYNTDADGLFRSLNEHAITLRESHIVIIGAGGAARAVAMLCAREKANKITIINRTRAKAQELAHHVRRHYPTEMEVLGFYDIHGIDTFDVAIQTTPIGMSPNVLNNPVTDDSFYDKFHTAVDLIYNPGKTAFLKKAEEKGIQILNGFEMLLYQGIKAYEIWNNVEISDTVLEEVIRQIKNQNG